MERNSAPVQPWKFPIPARESMLGPLALDGAGAPPPDAPRLGGLSSVGRYDLDWRKRAIRRAGKRPIAVFVGTAADVLPA